MAEEKVKAVILVALFKGVFFLQTFWHIQHRKCRPISHYDGLKFVTEKESTWKKILVNVHLPPWRNRRNIELKFEFTPHIIYWRKTMLRAIWNYFFDIHKTDAPKNSNFKSLIKPSKSQSVGKLNCILKDGTTFFDSSNKELIWIGRLLF